MKEEWGVTYSEYGGNGWTRAPVEHLPFSILAAFGGGEPHSGLPERISDDARFVSRRHLE